MGWEVSLGRGTDDDCGEMAGGRLDGCGPESSWMVVWLAAVRTDEMALRAGLSR